MHANFVLLNSNIEGTSVLLHRIEDQYQSNVTGPHLAKNKYKKHLYGLEKILYLNRSVFVFIRTFFIAGFDLNFLGLFPILISK